MNSLSVDCTKSTSVRKCGVQITEKLYLLSLPSIAYDGETALHALSCYGNGLTVTQGEGDKDMEC